MNKNIKFVQGNEAVAEAAMYACLSFFAGYPITPSSEIAEILAKRLPANRGKFIQMEDEIASLCAIIGASLTGHKVMTATSGRKLLFSIIANDRPPATRSAIAEMDAALVAIAEHY